MISKYLWPYSKTTKGVTENNTNKCEICHQSIFNVEKCLTILVSNCDCIILLLVKIIVNIYNFNTIVLL